MTEERFFIFTLSCKTMKDEINLFNQMIIFNIQSYYVTW